MPTMTFTPKQLLTLVLQLEKHEIEWFIKDLDKNIMDAEMAINLAKYFADETKDIRKNTPTIHQSFMRHVSVEE